ncbi:MAG: succinate dehydrogenase/fumarate reductase flavoprotein subunit, partial [Firmicutes bacterium]|nr:succinate dehydrogenase/fumarate reductase flavoprotein subunit [Bacillota bacterium]
MYTDPILQSSAEKVASAREANLRLDPRRMTAEEKDILLKTYHPDYRGEEFSPLDFGPNRGEKVPLELKALLEGSPRILNRTLDLDHPDYQTDVLII